MPTRPDHPGFLIISQLAALLTILLYCVSPWLRSLPFLLLPACFLVVWAVLATRQGAALLTVFLYCVSPWLRSLSYLQLAGCFVVVWVLLAARQGAALLTIFLYCVTPWLRSLSSLQLAGCFLVVRGALATVRWALRKKAASNVRSNTRRQSESLRWYGKGQVLQVGPYTLNDPLVYISSGEEFVDEVSCIDVHLPIGKPAKERPGDLGYFPEYARLTPVQRANYLEWLAKGRAGPLASPYYALLFLYGLERRLLIDQKDLGLIIEEMVRLLQRYKFSGTCEASLRRFLSFSLARAGIDRLNPQGFEAVFERPGTGALRDEQHLAVGLAYLFTRQRPLPASWALRIAELDPTAPRGVVLERVPEQFAALFCKRYQDRHGKGLLLKTAKRDCEIAYGPSSPSLSNDSALSGVKMVARIPNVLGHRIQFASLLEIWTACIEDLKPLSRVLARGAEGRKRAAHDALPVDLKAEIEHPDKAAWDRLATRNAEEDKTAIVAVGELAALQEIATRSKLTARQSESLARTADAVGFVIEPDVRVTQAALRLGRPGCGTVPAGTGGSRPACRRVPDTPGAALMLELGMFVAAADGQVEQAEVNQIARFLETELLLDAPDARRIEALKRVCLRRRPSIAGIGKRLKAILSGEQLVSVGEFLVGIATSKGTPAKKEIAALRSAHRALGLDVKRLDGLLEEHRRRSERAFLVEMQPATESPDAGEAIPARPSAGPQTVFRLDPALLERLMHETRQVASLLDEAMQEEQPEEAAPPEPQPVPPDPATDLRFDGLAARYRPVIVELCTRPSWSRCDFETLVRNHSLMPSGTLDVINEWSQERFDEPIIEDEGEDLIVHTDLVLEQA